MYQLYVQLMELAARRRRRRQLRSCWWWNETTKLHEKIRSWNYSSRVSGRMMNTHTGRRSIHCVLDDDDDDVRCLALDVVDEDTQWSTRLRHLTNPHSRARGKDAARASEYVRECSSRCVCRARLLRAESRSREWRAITTTIRLRRRSHSRRRATLHKTRVYCILCVCVGKGNAIKTTVIYYVHFNAQLSKCYTHRIYFKKHKQRLRIQHTQRDDRFTEIQLRIKQRRRRRRQCRRLGTAYVQVEETRLCEYICAVRMGLYSLHTLILQRNNCVKENDKPNSSPASAKTFNCSNFVYYIDNSTPYLLSLSFSFSFCLYLISRAYPSSEQRREAARAKASILTRPSGPQYSSCVYTRAVSWLNFVYTLYTIARRPVIG
uniref:Uncharacterized protein n=1 Tax=Trichogramma kaykai TaxID=54128 RepID=A0ABD2WJH8_9HYME